MEFSSTLVIVDNWHKNKNQNYLITMTHEKLFRNSISYVKTVGAQSVGIIPARKDPWGTTASTLAQDEAWQFRTKQHLAYDFLENFW